MSVIRTQDLTVRYGAQEALARLTIEVEGGVVGLLGPNGAGKTTLLKALLGLVRPSGGKAEVLGVDVAAAPRELRTRVGFMPERNAFISELDAVETVSLTGELGGLPRRESLARAHEALRFAGLGEARYRLVETFSTGMLQRVKLATALVHDPELLLLDEPTSGLDPAGRREMLELITDLARHKGFAVILSTHLLHDVEAVADSVLMLDRGRLAAQGKVAVLKRAPAAAFAVIVREEEPGRFAAALAARGLSVNQSEDGVVQVPGAGVEPRLLFEVARETGTVVRHLRRVERNLEEFLLDALQDTPGQA